MAIPNADTIRGELNRSAGAKVLASADYQVLQAVVDEEGASLLVVRRDNAMQPFATIVSTEGDGAPVVQGAAFYRTELDALRALVPMMYEFGFLNTPEDFE